MKTLHLRIRLLGFCIALLVLLADQQSKAWVLGAFHMSRLPIVMAPFFNIVLVWNHGISFGMLGNLHSLMAANLTLILCIIVLVLAVWLWRTVSAPTALGLGCITGGATGNIMDRFRHGAVTDFLDFHVGEYHWPAFNVADSVIFIGVVILLGISIYSPRPKSVS